MSRTHTRGLPAGEVVLGLVIEHPDRGFRLERRLEDRFASARFAYSTAYSALRRLEKSGLVRAATGTPELGDSGKEDPADTEAVGGDVVYEATPEGVEHFRAWVRSSSNAPVLREELHARVALCEPRDLPRLIEVVHMEERVCVAELDRIRTRMLAEQQSLDQSPARELEWSRLMDRAVVHGEAGFWGGRITQLARLRSYLEELRPEAERRAREQHRHAHRRQGGVG
jgi:DNA-binding PadR family transcriptional regulator